MPPKALLVAVIVRTADAMPAHRDTQAIVAPNVTELTSVVGCERPPNWCHHGLWYSNDGHDCDGDGAPDPYCWSTAGHKGFISSADGCRDTWPHGKCASSVACAKPLSWCSHAGSVFSMVAPR